MTTASKFRSVFDRLAALAATVRRLLGLAELLRCESCSATARTADFTALEAGETQDQLCNDCHREHAALVASDAENRFAYYCR